MYDTSAFCKQTAKQLFYDLDCLVAKVSHILRMNLKSWTWNALTGKRRLDEMYHNATDRSEFYTMADTQKPPMFFRPITDPDKAALEFGTELPR